MRLATGCSSLSRAAWVAASVTLSTQSLAQSAAPPPALANWTGAIRCDIQSQAPGYAHQETQTWTLAGAPTVQGSVTVYPATWSVSGQGWHDRTRYTNRRVAQWAVTVGGGASAPARAAIGFTRHAVGGGFDVGRRNAQLTAGGGYAGPERYVNDGVLQPATRVAGTVYEWQFPKIDVATPQTRLVGTNSVAVTAYVGPLQPADAQSTVTCAWALGQGTAPALPPSTLTPLSPPASIAQAGVLPSTGAGVATRAPAGSSGMYTTPGSAPAAAPATTTASTSASAPYIPPATNAPRTSTSQSVTPPTTSAPTAGSSMITGGAAAGGPGVSSQLTLRCTPVSFPQYSASPGGITFTLQPLPGIVGYQISRYDLGQLTPTPVTASSYTHLAPLEYFTTYQYDVTGVRSDGTCISSAASITPPKPLTPQVTARVVVNGPTSRVTLTWGTQADRPTDYLVLGAGLPQNGVEVPASVTGHSLDTGNLTIGTHGWLVTPMWKTPSGAMIDVSTGARVSATVGASAGSVVPQTIWDALQKAADAYKAMLSATATVPR